MSGVIRRAIIIRGWTLPWTLHSGNSPVTHRLRFEKINEESVVGRETTLRMADVSIKLLE